MPNFRLVALRDPSAATVHLFMGNLVTKARITWPDHGRASSLNGASAGIELPPDAAMKIVHNALAFDVIDDVVVQLDELSFWEERWGRLL